MTLYIDGGVGIEPKGEEIRKLSTTMKWEMGETTIGVIPDYDSESAVDFLNGWVINRI